MKNSISSASGKHTQQQFSNISFWHMTSEMQQDYIAAFAKESSISIEEAEFVCEEINPVLIIKITEVAENGDTESEIVSVNL